MITGDTVAVQGIAERQSGVLMCMLEVNMVFATERMLVFVLQLVKTTIFQKIPKMFKTNEMKRCDTFNSLDKLFLNIFKFFKSTSQLLDFL